MIKEFGAILVKIVVVNILNYIYSTSQIEFYFLCFSRSSRAIVILIQVVFFCPKAQFTEFNFISSRLLFVVVLRELNSK